MKRRAGVTLIELVVVLVIIAVTAAILLPVFTKSHGGNSHISCYSNLRQIGLGMVQYVQDNDGHLPRRQSPSGVHGEVVSWRDSTYPYIKSKQVYRCPTSPAREAPDIERDGFMRSYAVNSTTVAKYDASGPFSDVYGGKSKLAFIPHPDSVILVSESTAAFSDMSVTNPAAFTSPYSPSRTSGALYAGHNGVTICLFADGHVKALRPMQTYDMGSQNLWTRDNSRFSAAEQLSATQVLQFGADQYKASAQ